MLSFSCLPVILTRHKFIVFNYYPSTGNGYHRQACDYNTMFYSWPFNLLLCNLDSMDGCTLLVIEPECYYIILLFIYTFYCLYFIVYICAFYYELTTSVRRIFHGKDHLVPRSVTGRCDVFYISATSGRGQYRSLLYMQLLCWNSQ